MKDVVKQMHMTSLIYLDLKREEVVETYPCSSNYEKWY